MIRKGCGALVIAIVILIVGAWLYARIDEACLAGGDTTEIQSVADGFTIDGRAYRVGVYVAADYGVYSFPGGLFRGHPVSVGVDLSAVDDRAMPELRPECVRMRHGAETITHRAAAQERVDVRTDLTQVAHLQVGGTGRFPEWPPNDTVHVWLRLRVHDRAYLIDLGDATISSVARAPSPISIG